MAIAASGSVSLSDLRTEFVGGSGAISYSDLYRGGSNIRAKAADNTGVNLAASVPTSGTMNFTNFRSQAKGFRFTYTTESTDQDADTLFGTDYSVDYPKEILINSGVTIGGVSDDALDIPSTLAGTLVINNNGSIIGKGGAANGGAGGNAINNAALNVTINNAGSLLAGGGGGGQGGQGGNGNYNQTNNSGTRAVCNPRINGKPHTGFTYGSGGAVTWYGTVVGNVTSNQTSVTNGIYTYHRVNSYFSCAGAAHRIYRTWTSTVSSTGGSGGSGGRGQGYSQTLASGSNGSSASNNAGNGGSGASGAAYGVAGSSGSSGANGNSTNGSSGSSGGAAGAAVLGTSVTMNNTGTLAGAVA